MVLSLFACLLPDVVINISSATEEDITSCIFHELAHASLYAYVGNPFWINVIDEAVRDWNANGRKLSYGNYETSQYTGINELWAEYCEFLFVNKNNGIVMDTMVCGSYPRLEQEWVKCQVLHNISLQVGVVLSDIYYAIVVNRDGSYVTSLEELRQSLIDWMSCNLLEQKIINYNFGYFFDRLGVVYHFTNKSPMARFVDSRQVNDTTGNLERTFRFVDAREIITMVPYPYDGTVNVGNSTIVNHPQLTSLEFLRNKKFPFKEYAAVYDTNVMSMPLREFYERDSLNTFNHFFNKSSWKLKSVDSLNLTINYAYETDY